MTAKEANLLLRDYVMKYGYDKIDYTNFVNDLYSVRYELIQSRIMDTSVGELEELLVSLCKAATNDAGKIHLRALRSMMSECKQLCLTAF